MKLLTAVVVSMVLSMSYGVAEEKDLDISNSSFIEDAQYDNDDKTLIMHIDGREYEYQDVPEDVADDFEDAYSAGEFYNENIKGQYERY
jgi:hypothetical protein